MRETFVIAKRELLERVRTKWFVAITILGPILMIGLIVIPVLLAGRGSKHAKVEIVDETGTLGPRLVELFAADHEHWKTTVVPSTTTDAELLGHIRTHAISGFIRIPKDALDRGAIVYRGDNATNQQVAMTLHTQITYAVLEQRGAAHDLSRDDLKAMLRPPTISELHTNGESKGESGEATFLLGYLVAFILYMVITIYGVNVMRSVITEKTSRVVELLVAATKPRSMMVGKIVGVGGAGLAQISLWLIVGAIGLQYRDELLGLFHVHGDTSSLPTLTAGGLFVIVAFFVLGYAFYSTLFAAIGAMVSSEQDSQQAAMPVTMLLVIGMVSMTAITGDPRGSTAGIMTQIPCWSPMLMPLRYLLGGATAGDVALSLVILLASTVVVARAAAKIYRVGILMYGKRPSLGELVRWLRY